jgi:hypothetical protein
VIIITHVDEAKKNCIRNKDLVPHHLIACIINHFQKARYLLTANGYVPHTYIHTYIHTYATTEVQIATRPALAARTTANDKKTQIPPFGVAQKCTARRSGTARHGAFCGFPSHGDGAPIIQLVVVF